MFNSLEAFRGQLKGLTVAINFVSGGQQFVMVTPVVTDDAKTKNPELAQPFSFTATAAELDAEFAGAIGALANARQTLAEQVAAQAAALKAKAPKPAATTGGGKKSAEVSIDDDEDIAETSPKEPKAAEGALPQATVAPAVAAAPLTADSLFE